MNEILFNLAMGVDGSRLICGLCTPFLPRTTVFIKLVGRPPSSEESQAVANIPPARLLLTCFLILFRHYSTGLNTQPIIDPAKPLPPMNHRIILMATITSNTTAVLNGRGSELPMYRSINKRVRDEAVG